MQPKPETFLTSLAAVAAQMHEMFTAFQEAGFTEEQAMTLVLGVVHSHETKRKSGE